MKISSHGERKLRRAVVLAFRAIRRSGLKRCNNWGRQARPERRAFMQPHTQALDVWGELACFTRPDAKVERFSYPVITPSAARGIFDAVYRKPKFYWQVTRVDVFTTPSYLALRRNEVKEKISVSEVARWMKNAESEISPLFADATGDDYKGRTQRQTMALKNVRYRLYAEIRPWPQFAGELTGMEQQFLRRAARGQCVYQPYFGCREFPAYFALATDDAPAPVALTQDLGWMLYDVFDLSRPGHSESRPAISLFAARLEQGVMRVPDYASDAVLKTEGR
jgi:CRISPR-associated protein Cas5d